MKTLILSLALATANPVSSQPIAAVETVTPATNEATKSLFMTAGADAKLGYFESAIKRAGLKRVLNQKGPFTVFAPTNKAFESLPRNVRQRLMQNNNGTLTELMKYHVVEGTVHLEDLQDGQRLKTLSGESLLVSRKGQEVYINGIKIEKSDIPASNGLIHTMDHIAPIIR